MIGSRVQRETETVILRSVEEQVQRGHDAGFVNGYFWADRNPRHEQMDPRGYVHYVRVKDDHNHAPVPVAIDAIIDGGHDLDDSWTLGAVVHGPVLAFRSERDAVLVKMLMPEDFLRG